MNRRLFGAFGVLAIAAAAVGGCKSDPLANSDGTPAQLVTDFTHLQIGVGQTASVTASVVDARATPLAIPVTFTACNGVVTTAIDPNYRPEVPPTSTRGLITAVTPAPSCVVVAGGGFTDTVTVSAVPLAFTGNLSSASPKGGDTLTISSTAQLKFDTSVVSVTFGGGQKGLILSKSTDVVKLLVPFGATPAPLQIAGVLVTSYSPPLAVTLPTSTSVAPSGDRWAPGDTGYATAPTLALPTATGDSTVYLMGVPGVNNDANCGEGTAAGGTGNCTIFKYTANGTDSLQFTTNWSPPTVLPADNSDIDTYSCGSAGVSACFEDGGAGATAKTPEKFSFKPTAGTHYFVIEQYSSGENPTVTVTIKKLN